MNAQLPQPAPQLSFSILEPQRAGGGVFQPLNAPAWHSGQVESPQRRSQAPRPDLQRAGDNFASISAAQRQRLSAQGVRAGQLVQPEHIEQIEQDRFQALFGQGAGVHGGSQVVFSAVGQATANDAGAGSVFGASSAAVAIVQPEGQQITASAQRNRAGSSAAAQGGYSRQSVQSGEGIQSIQNNQSNQSSQNNQNRQKSGVQDPGSCQLYGQSASPYFNGQSDQSGQSGQIQHLSGQNAILYSDSQTQHSNSQNQHPNNLVQYQNNQIQRQNCQKQELPSSPITTERSTSSIGHVVSFTDSVELQTARAQIRELEAALLTARLTKYEAGGSVQQQLLDVQLQRERAASEMKAQFQRKMAAYVERVGWEQRRAQEILSALRSENQHLQESLSAAARAGQTRPGGGNQGAGMGQGVREQLQQQLRDATDALDAAQSAQLAAEDEALQLRFQIQQVQSEKAFQQQRAQLAEAQLSAAAQQIADLKLRLRTAGGQAQRAFDAQNERKSPNHQDGRQNACQNDCQSNYQDNYQAEQQTYRQDGQQLVQRAQTQAVQPIMAQNQPFWPQAEPGAQTQQNCQQNTNGASRAQAVQQNQQADQIRARTERQGWIQAGNAQESRQNGQTQQQLENQLSGRAGAQSAAGGREAQSDSLEKAGSAAQGEFYQLGGKQPNVHLAGEADQENILQPDAQAAPDQATEHHRSRSRSHSPSRSTRSRGHSRSRSPDRALLRYLDACGLQGAPCAALRFLSRSAPQVLNSLPKETIAKLQAGSDMVFIADAYNNVVFLYDEFLTGRGLKIVSKHGVADAVVAQNRRLRDCVLVVQMRQPLDAFVVQDINCRVCFFDCAARLIDVHKNKQLQAVDAEACAKLQSVIAHSQNCQIACCAECRIVAGVQ